MSRARHVVGICAETFVLMGQCNSLAFIVLEEILQLILAGLVIMISTSGSDIVNDLLFIPTKAIPRSG